MRGTGGGGPVEQAHGGWREGRGGDEGGGLLHGCCLSPPQSKDINEISK